MAIGPALPQGVRLMANAGVDFRRDSRANSGKDDLVTTEEVANVHMPPGEVFRSHRGGGLAQPEPVSFDRLLNFITGSPLGIDCRHAAFLASLGIGDDELHSLVSSSSEEDQESCTSSIEPDDVPHPQPLLGVSVEEDRALCSSEFGESICGEGEHGAGAPHERQWTRYWDNYAQLHWWRHCSGR